MSLRKWVKRVGRKAAPVAYKVGRVVTPVVAAAGSFIGGPVVGAAISGIGGSAGYYARATAARADGTRGRAARELGRGERRRQFIYGMAGSGVGSAAAGVVAAAGGATFGQTVGAVAFGHGGSELLGIGGTIFSPTTTLPTGFGGVTGSQAAAASKAFGGGVSAKEAAAASAAFGGGISPAQSAAAAAAFSGASAGTGPSAATLLGVGSTALQTYTQLTGRAPLPGQGNVPGTNPATNAGGYEGAAGSNPWGTVNAGGDGGPGMSPGAIAALLLVGALVLAG